MELHTNVMFAMNGWAQKLFKLIKRIIQQHVHAYASLVKRREHVLFAVNAKVKALLLQSNGDVHDKKVGENVTIVVNVLKMVTGIVKVANLGKIKRNSEGG